MNMKIQPTQDLLYTYWYSVSDRQTNKVNFEILVNKEYEVVIKMYYL